MKLPADMTPAERALLHAFEALESDYLKLKRENEALRDEIHQLRQQLPTVVQALAESPAAFVNGFVEV